jgi:hypothetical protein
MSRLEQIKRAHASARPNPVENPAFFHTHNDLTYVLRELERLRETLTLIARDNPEHLSFELAREALRETP